MKIAHLSDIHIRFASRHDEYREVFKRLFDDLTKQKPNRIVITGDLSHLKVNMSPGSIDLVTEFLINSAKIAPVDIILGNHDLNLQQKEQGDTITPIFNIADKFSDLFSESVKKNTKKSFIVSKENALTTDFSKKGIYFFPDSDFYKISDDLVYGVYSCKDNKILTLDHKEPGVKYIALFHGQLKGARGDNGYEIMGDSNLNIATFNNFDIVLLGDIHEFQSFRDDESAAYAGSLIQQDYGESIDKGYLMWNLSNNSYQRRYILNDYGFAKITIAKGELIEERIENIKFSNSKKQTKVYIVWEDYEENYSTEKESQIARLVKERFGCDVVKVEFLETKKLQQENTDVADSRNEESFAKQITDYLKETNPDIEKETIDEVLALAKLIDSELEIVDTVPDIKLWDVDSVEISNIFSFPEKPIIINLEKLRGVTGIFGANYSGKSNVVKAIVWGLYQHILGGNTGSAKKLVNIYTSSSKGYVRIYLTIDGEKYLIYRGIETTTKKNGETSNTYPVEYKKLITDDDGKTKWVSEISDKKANEKKEVKDIIFQAIGSVEDFTKVCLQTQGGKEDYINQDQQPKNDLVNKFLGLEQFRDRYDYGNKEFNDVKKKQKELGDIVTLQAKVLELESNINKFQLEYDNLVKEKNDSESQKDKVDEKIIELSKSLKQYSPLLNGELDNEGDITISIENLKLQILEEEIKYNNLASWVSMNFKKELPFNEGETVESLSSELKKESDEFTKEKNKYIEIENWIKINPKKDITSIDGFDLIIQNLNFQIAGLKAKLPTYKGEQCPTCGHVTAQPNQELYNQCLDEITTQTGLLNNYINAVNQFHADNAHNNSCEVQNSNLQTLKANLTTRKNKKESITQRIALISQSQDILKHNQDVEDNNRLLLLTKNSIDNKTKLIEKFVLNIEKVKQNVESKKHNTSIEEEITQLQEEVKKYKFSIYGLSQQATDKNGDLRIEKNSLENYTSKLSEVTEAEKTYKKYSLYLQSVHRDGIPARIIRRKMPIINNKINSILSTIVNFKIEMSVTTKGDVIENFYFSKDKSDTLPLSFASGSQKFISSIVIKDALHYMSNLIKPSLNIIDEGFGTLDDDKIYGIITVIQYLKNKYKNVIIITHRNEIKDCANNIVEVYKTFENIPQEVLDANEHAGITKVNIL